MRESPKASAAFRVYVDLGPLRSLAHVQERIAGDPPGAGFERAPSLRTIESWSVKYGWMSRVADIEREARARDQEEYVQSVRDYRQRLRQEGLVLQQKGLSWLKEKDADDVRAQEAIRAIAEGFRLEALALGEVTERIAVEEEHSHVFAELSDDELRRLVALLRQGPATGPAGDGESAS
jgi:hypothetical protein